MDKKRIGYEREEWIHLAQDRDQLRTAVYDVNKVRVPQEADNFLLADTYDGHTPSHKFLKALHHLKTFYFTGAYIINQLILLLDFFLRLKS
jgi:hypothetical protein